MADNQFGKYELQSRLAAGGMAEIFKARYPVAAGISKAVVIKRILPHYAANKQFISMFTNEARIVMGLSHGNIAQVFDFGEIDGDWFIAMEYVDGQPLSKVIKRARTVGIQAIPTSFAVLISIEMLKGLHYAHTRLDDSGKQLKIVHRDVSPQNVLISYEGQIKLVDFGIAKAKTAGREETESGAVKGKYSYFSPEQARGKELDARTDVFAAGIVLYEMLCGQLPFQGRMIDTMSRIVKGQFAPPRAMNPDITPALEAIILTAMAQDREKRYANAEAFQSALSSYLYQNAPSFQTSSLGSFVQFLFEPDLVAEGRPVQLARQFLDQVTLWKKPLPQAPAEMQSPGETAWGRDPSKSQGRRSSGEGEPGVSSTGEAPSKPMSKAVRYGLLVAALGAGIGLVMAGHSIWTTTGTYSLELSSNVLGASVFVDGKPWGKKTPTVLELDASAAHSLELTYPGMKDWTRPVSGSRNDRISMHAELERIIREEAQPPPVVDAGVEKRVEVDTGPPLMAGFPDLVFKVHPKVHALKVPETKAARLKLTPSRTYKLWTEGKASLGGLAAPIWVTDVAYFAQGPGVSAKESFGVLGPKPVTIKGTTMLYAFLMDHAVEDNTGVIKVRLKDNKGGSETLTVSSTQHVVILEPTQRMTYVGFNNLTQYNVRLLENGPAPRTRGERGGTVSKVLVTQQSGFNVFEGKPINDDAVRVFELGKMYKVRGTGFIWLTFLDDDLGDNSGSIDVEVIPTANPLGGFKFPLGSGTSFGQ